MTRDERRKVAGLLRGMSGHTAGLSDGEFIDLVEDVVRGGDVPASQDPDAAFLDRLADLIDPTAHERTVADNLALIDRNRELECELAALKAKLGAAERIAGSCRDRARAISEGAGDREIRGSDLGRMHAYFRVADEIAGALR